MFDESVPETSDLPARNVPVDPNVVTKTLAAYIANESHEGRAQPLPVGHIWLVRVDIVSDKDVV